MAHSHTITSHGHTQSVSHSHTVTHAHTHPAHSVFTGPSSRGSQEGAGQSLCLTCAASAVATWRARPPRGGQQGRR
eukprot:scaffold121886_cov32-Phaeocystis_antarctica.AAC.2